MYPLNIWGRGLLTCHYKEQSKASEEGVGRERAGLTTSQSGPSNNSQRQAMARNQQDAGQQLMKKHVGVGATKLYATNVIYH